MIPNQQIPTETETSQLKQKKHISCKKYNFIPQYKSYFRDESMFHLKHCWPVWQNGYEL